MTSCGAGPAAEAAGSNRERAMTAHDTQQRPMRRDAVRNHRLVVEAAREVLREHGTDASMELIASRAGVGVGTLYRRFPNKEALVDEIARQMLVELVGEAQRALSHPDGTGFEAFVRVLGDWISEHRGYAGKLVGRSKASCLEQLRDLLGALVAQAQEHGRLSPDVSLGDVMALAWGLRGVIETTSAVTPDAWQRFADIYLAGLRVQGATARPALTSDELTQVSGETAVATEQGVAPGAPRYA